MAGTKVFDKFPQVPCGRAGGKDANRSDSVQPALDSLFAVVAVGGQHNRTCVCGVGRVGPSRRQLFGQFDVQKKNLIYSG